MNLTKLILLILLSFFCVFTTVAQVPRVFLSNAQALQQTRQKIRSGDKTYSAALAKLERDAVAALKIPTMSVMDKAVTPPSGDKHDYMSQAPYFWPDPKSANGLPYIRRDGERNPEISKIPDHENQDKMIAAVDTLALAYYFKGDERYAAKAVGLMRAWFLDPATKMNPNLQYAQGIPGITTGRGIGLIETRWLGRVTDAVGLLEGSKALTDADKRGMKEWFGKFLQWMLDSKNGKEEAEAKNNHGTYYDVQIVCFALFVGRNDLAKTTLETAKQKRIARQIEPDGRQPLELERTKAWSYSVMNLEGLIMLADLGEKVGVDLWNYKTADGRGIRKALDFLYPFSSAESATKWKYQQIEGWPANILFPLIRRASNKYYDENFKTMTAKAPAVESTSRENLLFANK